MVTERNLIAVILDLDSFRFASFDPSSLLIVFYSTPRLGLARTAFSTRQHWFPFRDTRVNTTYHHMNQPHSGNYRIFSSPASCNLHRATITEMKAESILNDQHDFMMLSVCAANNELS